MAEEILLTQQEFDKIVQEHEELITVGRKKAAEDLKEAKSYGDLSENAEYDAAKDAQAELEERISRLEYMMRNARIISEDDLTGEHVNLGLGVKIKDMKSKKEYTYTIVGITNADPFQGKISNESPVGIALLGAKVGDVVSVSVDAGELQYKILDIQKNSRK